MQEVYHPGDIEIKKCNIVNYKGNYLSIRDILLEFNIYTDLYNTGIKCDIVIGDALGLIERLPIVGDEMIYISFKTPTFEKDIEYVFYLYKISDRQHLLDRADTYILHGCSSEYINDAKTSVTKAFKNQSISEYIPSIYNQYLKPDKTEFNLLLPKEVETDNTFGESYYVSAGFSPFRLIRDLSKEAMAEDSTKIASTFLFYETEDNWYFKNVESLLQEDPVDDFYFAQADLQIVKSDGTESVIFPYQKIIEVNYAKSMDVIKNLMGGFYDNEVNVFDPRRKLFSRTSFKYDTDFNVLSHLGNGKSLTENSVINKTDGSSLSNYIISEIGENYSNLDYIKKGISQDPTVKSPRFIHKFLKYNVSAFSALDNIALDIIIPGNSDLRIGNVINVFIQQTSSDIDYRVKPNILFGDNNTSKFLITALRHSYNKNNNSYITSIQCIKDTYFKDPEEIN